MYYHFAKWRDDHTWERINDDLAKMVRVKAGKEPTPSMLLVDSQSVKSTESAGMRAFDGGQTDKRDKAARCGRYDGANSWCKCNPCEC